MAAVPNSGAFKPQPRRSTAGVNTPFFTIVTVARNDAWAMTKSMRSVFRQSFVDFEYVVVDGASTDGSTGLIDFWQSQGLVTRAISEPDTGVYDAMNKGIDLARGRFVCFLNAGDIFKHDEVLSRVHALLADSGADGTLGWGELNNQVWSSWVEHDGIKLSSLGFCHQALFVRRELLVAHPFDTRPFKTDSDTQQLGRLFAAGACIPIVPEVWAVRGGEPGISAQLERTKTSILDTLLTEYGLEQAEAEAVIAFRRQCAAPARIIGMLQHAPRGLATALALMVLDTLYLQASLKLARDDVDALIDAALQTLDNHMPDAASEIVDRLIAAQTMRQQLLRSQQAEQEALKNTIAVFGSQEAARRSRNAASPMEQRVGDFNVSLTSFPARIRSVHFVIRSLLDQELRPQAVHLWLGQDEFPALRWLPTELLALQKEGLSIHLVPRTFHQYDKFMHEAGELSQLPFVIVDDDVIYPPAALRRLLTTHEIYPDCVVANRCHMMQMTGNGLILPYADWPREVTVDTPSLLAFPTGAGGVLYPPGFFADPMVVNARDALAVAPYADDVWLKACALAKGLPSVTPTNDGSSWYLRYTPTMQQGALHSTNVDRGLNDVQLRRAEHWLDTIRPAWRQALIAELR